MTSEEWRFFVQCFISLIAILNPVGSLPVYLTLQQDGKGDRGHRIATVTTLTVFGALTVFMLFGDAILAFFSISLPAFRISGGILILVMALSMLQGKMSGAKHTPEEAAGLSERQSIAVVPLGTPILAGPGSISTVILLSHHAHTWLMSAALFCAILLCAVLVYVAFLLADKLNVVLGIIGIKIVTRIMGLILSAVAVQFMADGLLNLFPALAVAP